MLIGNISYMNTSAGAITHASDWPNLRAVERERLNRNAEPIHAGAVKSSDPMLKMLIIALQMIAIGTGSHRSTRDKLRVFSRMTIATMSPIPNAAEKLTTPDRHP